eukprot:1186763-Prorocentrum_minimum.AAC.1
MSPGLSVSLSLVTNNSLTTRNNSSARPVWPLLDSLQVPGIVSPHQVDFQHYGYPAPPGYWIPPRGAPYRADSRGTGRHPFEHQWVPGMARAHHVPHPSSPNGPHPGLVPPSPGAIPGPHPPQWWAPG